MSNFVYITKAIQFKRITYYSVQFDGEPVSMFLNFIQKHSQEEYREELFVIRKWLQKLGNEIGADRRYFRVEGAGDGEAKAFPPPARYLNMDCSLRLYCMWMSRSAVILFDGAEKTANSAQDCPNVSSHFRLANKLTKAISQAQYDKDISLDPETDLLVYDPELPIYL